MKRFVHWCAVVLSLAAVPVLAQDWSAVGSVGHVDESSSALYEVNGPDLRFKASQLGTIVARYHVTNTYGSAVSFVPPWGTLLLAYVDNGSQSTIHARLVRVDLCTNVITTLCEIKSQDGGSASQCDKCSLPERVDFQNYVYYVEVDLSRTSPNGMPVIHHVALY